MPDLTGASGVNHARRAGGTTLSTVALGVIARQPYVTKRVTAGIYRVSQPRLALCPRCHVDIRGSSTSDSRFLLSFLLPHFFIELACARTVQHHIFFISWCGSRYVI